ncbi:MAG: dihydroorotase [Actinobacteria bacterium]|nr:dihydroorotase [Actinomycetota bacterium]
MSKFTLIGGITAAGQKLNITISGNKISELTIDTPVAGNEILDITGSLIIPGLVDLHTHLREPGKEDAENVESGSRAAVKGGYTAISAMPNTDPVADTAGVVEQVFSLGKAAGLCDVFPIGAVTQGQRGGQLAEILAMAQSAAKVRMFSDDGHCVFDPLVMRRALEYVKMFDGVIAQHAQDPRLTIDAQMNEGEISAKLGLKGWPAVAEEAIIARDILLTDHVQSRLHICHVTTAGGVELIRWAKSRGINVTAEVTPHHLLLTDDLAESYDPIYKVNPPLRNVRDVEALREGLADGTIDIVATDHAPHPTESKECEWQAASFGMIGLETALSVVVKTMISSKLMNWNDLVDRMAIAPARIGGYAEQGKEFALGNFANITVVNPNKTWIVNKDASMSKSRNTPFHGLELPGVITDVFFNGARVLQDEKVIGKI